MNKINWNLSKIDGSRGIHRTHINASPYTNVLILILSIQATVTVEATAVEEEEAVGQLPMVRETTTVGIEVGRASTILGLSAAATEGTEGEVEATIVGMMGARPVRTTGLFHYQGIFLTAHTTANR